MIIKSPASAENTRKILIVLVGPTAIGKTGLAIRLARHFNTVILSADSRQFYQELRIGTAAPTPEELAAARHYFSGHLSVNDYYNVSQYGQEAVGLLDEIFEKNEFAVLAGGSGLYVDAVCQGIDDMPDPDINLRKQIEESYLEKGIEYLRQKLAALDPEYFGVVDNANPNRMKRAIEVCLQTGRTYTSFRVKKPEERNFRTIKIGINRPRQELFDRIEKRTDAMISHGLVGEVKGLIPHRHLNALKTVGYKEIFEYLDGEVTLTRAIENIKTNTRRYARRQLTWFKRDKEIRWFLPEDYSNILEYINSRV
jgi:tRNA dimethylallyltransferase